MTAETPGQIAPTDRVVFARIADVLIPAADGMPGASEVGIEGDPLDHVLALRPELTGDLLRGLRAVADVSDGVLAADRLNEYDPAAMGAIGAIAAAAYYMQPAVRNLIGYPGQTHRPVRPEEEDDFRQGDLLAPVIDRGPIYRPTPK